MIKYFIVNEDERNKFEKEYQVPYGYHTCPHFSDEELAIGYVEMLRTEKRDKTVVEKWENGNKEVVYHGSWYDPSLDIEEYYKD